MRELKFRRPYYNKYNEFSYFWNWSTSNMYFPDPAYNEQYKNDEQYIGIKDTEGNEIYEGDIVRYEWVAAGVKRESIGEIVFYQSGFYTRDKNGRYSRVFTNTDTLVKVIGNIHQNPEMINANNKSN